MSGLSARQPALDSQTLRLTYEALRRSELSENNPFMGFVLLYERLHVPYRVAAPQTLKQATIELLTEILSEELAYYRALYHLSAPHPHSALDKAIQEMKRDGQQNNEWLIACSALYYRYIRADLALSAEQIADYLGYDDRHIRRFVKVYWEHLVDVFISKELQARRQYQQQRCQLALPRYSYIPLAQREKQIIELARITQKHLPPYVFIYGTVGSGKTTVAWRLAREWIESQWIEDMAWLSFGDFSPPKTADELAALINQTLDLVPLGDPITTLKTYLRFLDHEQTRLLVVFDGADHWGEIIHQALDWLSHCVVIVTARHRYTDWAGIEWECGMLNEEESRQLLTHLDQRQQRPPHSDTPLIHTLIWQAVGGNPSLLSTVHRLSESAPPEHISWHILQEYHLRQWHQLSDDTRQLWILMEMLSVNHPVPYAELIEASHNLGMPIEIEKRIMHLVEMGLVDVSNDRLSYTYQPVTMVAAILIENEAIDRDMEIIAYRILQNSHAQLDSLIFPLLKKYGQRLSPTIVFALMKTGQKLIFENREWLLWQALITQIKPTLVKVEDTLWLDLQQSRLYRLQGKYHQAFETIESAIENARREALRLILVEALLEQSSLYFYRHQSDMARRCANEAYQLLEDQDPTPLRRQAILLMAQALSHAEPAKALEWLERLDQRDASAWHLMAHVTLNQSNLAQALDAAQRSLDLIDRRDIYNYARGLGLLGRILIAYGETVEGVAQFQMAINLLQNTNDHSGLARMFNNFGVALLKNGDVGQARLYFQQSLQLHHVLEDLHGKTIAEENLQYIDALRRPKRRFLHDRNDYTQ